MRALLKEPLLHFAVVGVGLFALHAAVNRAPERTIVVGPAVRAELADGHRAAYGQAADAATLDALVQGWVDDEVLFREGLEKSLQKDDARIRQRVVAKMAYLMRSALVLPEPTDAELRARFELDPSKYAKADTLDFTHVYVDGDGPESKAKAEALLPLLRSGADPGGLGDTFSGGRRYRERSPEQLGESFGPQFVDGLAAQAPGAWQLRASRFGWHLVRLDKAGKGAGADFAAARDALRTDWLEAEREKRFRAQLASLRASWKVQVQP